MDVIEADKFLWVGNNLSLDFVNTEIVENGEPKDLFESPEDFLRWAVIAKLWPAAEAKKTARNWRAAPSGDEFFDRLKKFRKTLREAIERLARGENLKSAMVGHINAVLRAKSGLVEIAPTSEGKFEKIYRADFAEPHQLLAPVAESMADLLCYGDLSLLKRCENPACVLYFYDTTKNHQRRWCSMAGCGNRAKAAAFYQRRRENRESKKRVR